jgi:hypothetical protein
MIDEKEQARKFYGVIWNRRDHSIIPEVLHEDLKFRGSFGDRDTRRAGFAGYPDAVHETLSGCRRIIEERVSEPGKVFAKMTFGGDVT